MVSHERPVRVVPRPRVTLTLAALMMLGCAESGPACTAGEGVALVFGTTQGTPADVEASRPSLEAIPGTQLIIGAEEVVVFFAASDAASHAAARDKVLAVTEPLGLVWTTEGPASLDVDCTVRLKQQSKPIKRAPR